MLCTIFAISRDITASSSAEGWRATSTPMGEPSWSAAASYFCVKIWLRLSEERKRGLNYVTEESGAVVITANSLPCSSLR